MTITCASTLVLRAFVLQMRAEPALVVAARQVMDLQALSPRNTCLQHWLQLFRCLILVSNRQRPLPWDQQLQVMLTPLGMLEIRMFLVDLVQTHALYVIFDTS